MRPVFLRSVNARLIGTTQNMIEQFFRLRENQTTIRREVVAGLTTFAAMSYILVVNPSILSQTGLSYEGLITVTALAAAFGSLAMALLTNYPIALAPGMGLNAYFTYTVVLTQGIPVSAALGLVFWNGRFQGSAHVLPTPFHSVSASASSAGSAFSSPLSVCRTAVSSQAIRRHWSPWVTFPSRASSSPSAAFCSCCFLSSAVFPEPSSSELFIDETFLKLDLLYLFQNFGAIYPILLALLFVDLFDTIGTLIGVSRRANLLDKNGDLPKMSRAMAADATATTAGALLGTSTTTSYVESAAGIEAGGRTGLTAVTVAGCFLLALIFTPILTIIPPQATAPALIMVGIFMLHGLARLDFEDLTELAPAFVTMIAMPLTFSISEGIALGFITYVVIKGLSRQADQVTPLTAVLALVFLLHYLFL